MRKFKIFVEQPYLIFNPMKKTVFALKSVCDFPETIEQGDTFSFEIDNDKEILCPVCLAYSPVPRKSVSITVKEN